MRGALGGQDLACMAFACPVHGGQFMRWAYSSTRPDPASDGRGAGAIICDVKGRASLSENNNQFYL